MSFPAEPELADLGPPPDEARRLLQRRLSPKRFAHTLRVAEQARELARVHHVEAMLAECAGLWHDAYKEVPLTEQVERAREEGILTPDWERHPHLLHGPLAAACLPTDFGVGHAAVRRAIALHTTGAAGMQPLDMVVYLADLLEPQHSFPGIEDLRRLAAQAPLRRAMRAALDHGLHYLLQRGAWIDPQALAGRNDLLMLGE